MWSQLKATPKQNRDMPVEYAIGMWEKVLKRMWSRAVFDSTELHRLGWQIVKRTLVLDLTSASGEVPTGSKLENKLQPAGAQAGTSWSPS